MHGLEHNRDYVHHTQEFILHLIGTAEDMRIILRETTDTSQPMKLATLFVTANRTELGQAQRQIFIRTGRVLVNHTVMRAVHRLQEVLLTFFRRMDGLERIFTIFGIVSGSDI